VEKKGVSHVIKGFSHWNADSLAGEISNFLHENPDLEFVDIKYSSHGYEKGQNDHNDYSAILICREK
jgi:hypothetical protein